MATKNRDGLTVRYGLEQVADVTVSSAAEFDKGYCISLRGSMREKALDIVIPKGTYVGGTAVLLPVEPFKETDQGTVTVKLVKKSDGDDIKTFLNAAGVATLNAGSIIAPNVTDAAADVGVILTEDAVITVTTANAFSDEGLARLVISAVQGS